MPREAVHPFQHDVGPMGKALLPAVGLLERRLDQTEVAAAIVGQDVERFAAMTDGVLVILSSWRDHAPGARRIVRRKEADLASGVTVGRHEEKRPTARTPYLDRESLVRLLVDQGRAGFPE